MKNKSSRDSLKINIKDLKGFVDQQMTLDPKTILNAVQNSLKDPSIKIHNPSTNPLDMVPKEMKLGLSGRSNVEETKIVSPKNISLPKVSPFAKSIPIKKHSIKLFSEEDEYLMS